MIYEKKRIYIVVKTYPSISEKYSELVCTAGIMEDGTWIRLYPIPYRQLEDKQKYQKYTWIEVEAARNFSDFRRESYRPNLPTLAAEKREKGRKADWDERKRILFHNQEIYTNMTHLITLTKPKINPLSIAIFKPKEIEALKIENDQRDWDPEKIAKLKAESMQMHLFKDEKEIENEFRLATKIPYKFSYRFTDDEGRESTLMIEDWEIGMLYLNCLKGHGGDERMALDDVRKKYYDYFLTRDLYFILGTTKAHHRMSKNPFLIIGVFYPPRPRENKEERPQQYEQLSLFDL